MLHSCGWHHTTGGQCCISYWTNWGQGGKNFHLPRRSDAEPSVSDTTDQQKDAALAADNKVELLCNDQVGLAVRSAAVYCFQLWLTNANCDVLFSCWAPSGTCAQWSTSYGRIPGTTSCSTTGSSHELLQDNFVQRGGGDGKRIKARVSSGRDGIYTEPCAVWRRSVEVQFHVTLHCRFSVLPLTIRLHSVLWTSTLFKKLARYL